MLPAAFVIGLGAFFYGMDKGSAFWFGFGVGMMAVSAGLMNRRP